MKKALFIAILIIILLPIAINYTMQLPMIVPYVGDAKDWLAFWGSYLSAAVSSVMIVFTGYSLYEMKYEWNEDRKARLIITLEAKEDIFMIRVKNIGKMPAHKIQMKFEENFINSLFSKQLQNVYRNLQHKRFYLEGGESKYFYLSPVYSDKRSIHKFQITGETFTSNDINKWLDSFRNKTFNILVKYNDRDKYSTKLSLTEFLVSSLEIKDDIPLQLTSISNVISETNERLENIHEDLERISRQQLN